MDNSFFDETTEQSQVKAAIVAKYFDAWAHIIVGAAKRYGNTDRIVYIDLFAGPGRYKDGTKSTPLLVLETAIADPDMRKMLVVHFNDRDPDNADSLAKAIAKLPGIDRLKFQPQVHRDVVGEDIVETLNSIKLAPTLFFVDPWGYKGLSLDLIWAVLKDWGSDCIFFFNYSRINAGLSNRYVAQHMDALFGPERAPALRRKLEPMMPRDREFTIVEELAQALKAKGGKYVLPFGFRNAAGKRTTHHLIFVTKHFKGYETMKDIMARESTSRSQGVPSFMYNPADRLQRLLFELARPLDDLGEMLLTEYAGRTLTMREIYVEHSLDRPYVAKNYKQVLGSLEKTGLVRADPPAAERKKNTFADKVSVMFPAKRGKSGR